MSAAHNKPESTGRPCVGFRSLLSFLVCVLIGQILKPEPALSESSTCRTGAGGRPSSFSSYSSPAVWHQTRSLSRPCLGMRAVGIGRPVSYEVLVVFQVNAAEEEASPMLRCPCCGVPAPRRRPSPHGPHHPRLLHAMALRIMQAGWANQARALPMQAPWPSPRELRGSYNQAHLDSALPLVQKVVSTPEAPFCRCVKPRTLTLVIW